MESEDLLRYYLDEVRDTQHDINNLVIEEHIPNDAELAAEFLVKVGLSNLNHLYEDGTEICETVIVDTLKQKHLSERQAQTVRSRIATLNKTLRSRQPRRKQRQDVRDVAWELENSSTGTRSRSVTPDSLDSGDNLASQDSVFDDDHQLSSLPPFSLEHPTVSSKTKIKWTSSEPLQGNRKLTRHDNRGDIAHLGSENVVLKAYQPLTENGSPISRPARERSGSDPSPEIHLKSLNVDIFNNETPSNLHSQLTRRSGDRTNCSTVYISCSEPNEIGTQLSFENLIKHESSNSAFDSIALDVSEGVDVDELSDSEYQHLKPLLFVELIAIFDQYKIRCHKRKAAVRSKGGNVFGVNLSTLVMRDMPTPTDNMMVPQVFRSIVEHLNSRCLSEDGILRLAGQKQKLEVLCSEIEAKFYSDRNYVDNLLKQATAHELTGILKKLLRELPEPIMTMELFDMFHKTGSIPDVKHQIQALNFLVLMLPIEHRNTFRILIGLFSNIISHEKENRMSLHNVAMITAPSFFPPKMLITMDNNKFNKLTKEEVSKQIEEAAICCRIMETILKSGPKLWTVPVYLAAQARESQKKAQVKKHFARDEDKKRIRPSKKTMLARSSTQYEPGPMSSARIQREPCADLMKR